MSAGAAHRPPIASATPDRKALILPGGGMRVAYQAGAVQALHEAGLRFSFADGTSGGLMNLAALLSGRAPDMLAKAWRSLNPKHFISPQGWLTYLRFPNISAFGDFDGIVTGVFPHLGIDLTRITHATGISATFNVCDFAGKAMVSFAQHEVALEHILAGMSLPIFTPAVEKDGRTYTDAVWISDCNMLAAVRGGANELWVVWCIGNTPAFRNGPLNQYVHMIEMSAIGALNAQLEDIARLNRQIADGERPYGHDQPIVVHVIRPGLPIPLDPDYVLGKVSGHALVDQGYQDACRYLAQHASQGSPLSNAATNTPQPGRGVSFSEVMTGRIAFDAASTQAGARDWNAIPLSLRATIDIRDVDAFVADPNHRGDMVAHVVSPRLGGLMAGRDGNFQLFAPGSRDGETLMIYEVGIVIDGEPHWLSGRKFVRRGPPWRLWRETTSLHVELHRGHDASGPVVARGLLRLGISDFLSLLLGLRSRDCAGIKQRLGAIFGFAGCFVGQLWRTYGLN